jgi:hypothetical protein
MRRTTVGLSVLAFLAAAANARAAGPSDIKPNGSIPGTDQFARLAGGFMTIGLIAAGLGFLISVAGVGIAGHSHNVHLRDRFKSGAFLSLLGTVAFGAANRLLEWAWSIGTGF